MMSRSSRSPLSLSERIAVSGFTQPAVVVAELTFAEPVDVVRLRAALREAERRWPRLASRLRRGGWVTARGAEIPVLGTLDRADLLQVPELGVEPPVTVHVDGPRLALRAHHALLDGAGAMQLAATLAAHYQQRSPPALRTPRRRTVRLGLAHGKRLPADAFACDATVEGAFAGLPVQVLTHTLAFDDLRSRARARGATVAEWVATCLLRGFDRYGLARGEAARARGLLVAAARPSAPGRFAATQLPVEASLVELASVAGTLHAVRRTLRAPRGDDTVARALFYLSRRVRPPQRRGPYLARSVHFTFSDLTHWNLAHLGSPREPLLSARVLVTPSHPEHAGLTLTRVGNRVELALIATRDVVPLDELCRHLLTTLEES